MANHKIVINWRDGAHREGPSTIFHGESVRFEGGFVLIMFLNNRIEAYPSQDIRSVFIND
jgi:hypothetical protein